MIICFCILINEQPASFPPLSLCCLFILCFSEIAGADNKLCHMMQVIWQVCIMSKANWIWQSFIISKRFHVIKDFWRLIIIWLVLIYVKFLMWTLNFFTTFVKFCWLSFNLFNSWRVMLWKTLVEWKKQSYATMYAHNSCCLLGFFMNSWFFFFFGCWCHFHSIFLLLCLEMPWITAKPSRSTYQPWEYLYGVVCDTNLFTNFCISVNKLGSW